MNAKLTPTAAPAALGAALVAVLALAALVVAPASAEAPTRDQYVQSAEPICKRNTLANQRLLRGVRRLIQRNQLRPASRRFARASQAFGRAVRQLTRLPRPVDDRPTVARWIKLLRKQTAYLSHIARALRAGNRFKSQRISVLLLRNANQANNAVLRFGFHWCRVRPGLVT
jgi:hypothetical protein